MSFCTSILTAQWPYTELHSAVHISSAGEHAFPLQPFLYKHLISSWELVAILAIVVQHVFPSLSSTPVGRTVGLWVRNDCLPLENTSLVSDTFCMLFESNSGWWNCIISPQFATKHQQTCLIQETRKWKILLAFPGPLADSKSWTGIHLTLALYPKAIIMLWGPKCCRDGSTDTAMITTMSSVLTALLLMAFQPPCVVSGACTNTLVYASSWLQRSLK